MNQVRGVLPSFIRGFRPGTSGICPVWHRPLVQHDFLPVVPQMVRVVAVRQPLAIVAVEFIDALILGCTFRPRGTESPFPEDSGHISVSFCHTEYIPCVSRNRVLPFDRTFFVASDRCVSRMQPRNQA